jgi:hypothetical protein
VRQIDIDLKPQRGRVMVVGEAFIGEQTLIADDKKFCHCYDHLTFPPSDRAHAGQHLTVLAKRHDPEDTWVAIALAIDAAVTRDQATNVLNGGSLKTPSYEHASQGKRVQVRATFLHREIKHLT